MTAIDKSLDLFGRKCKRIAHAQTCRGIILEVVYLCTLCLKLLRSVECDICLAGVKELLYILLVDVATLRLAIRAMVAAKADTFVELYAQPTEGLENILLGTWHKAVRIGIFDAEYQFTAILLGEKIII